MSRARVRATLALWIPLAMAWPSASAATAVAESSRSAEGRADRRPALARGESERLGGQPVVAPEGFDSIVIFATNSVDIKRASSVIGDVVVNDASEGPTLVPGFELELARDSSVDGDVTADSIELDRGASVTGDANTNDLTDKGGTIGGSVVSPLALPVFDELPVFQEAFPTAIDVHVAAGTTEVLPPGRYGALTIAQTGVLVLSGLYDFESVSAVSTAGGQCPFPCRSIHFAGAADVRVAGRFEIGKDAYVGPVDAQGAPAACPVAPGAGSAQAILYVGGTNGVAEDPSSDPSAFAVGQSSCLAGNVYAPNGRIQIDKDSVVTGALVGLDVRIDGGPVALDSAFGNAPPVAFPQTVFTQGASSIEITLAGADPEELDLSFSIAVAPAAGTLGPITPIVPDPEPEIDRSTGLPTGNTIQPPITSAVVTYSPADPGAIEPDAFTFSVTDPPGASGSAIVTINPPGDPTEPPVLGVIVAEDATLELEPGSIRDFVLAAGGPPGVGLLYTVLTLPEGVLSHAGDAIEPEDLPATLSGPELTYDAGLFEGTTSFQFEVSEDSATPTLLADTGVVSITVAPRPPLAGEDQAVTTAANQPVEITLQGNAGGSGSSSSTIRLFAEATTALGAAIAGNVGDADGDGFGDGRDPLPGSAPVLVSAGVDRNLTTQTYSDQASFLAAASGEVTFDFETASGFPASGGAIGTFAGIDFDAQTYDGLSVSGSQSLTGSTGTFGTATIDFTGLEQRPNGFGFFALDLTPGEVVRVTVDYTSGASEVIDVDLGGQPSFTPIFFGKIDTSETIASLSILGTDTGANQRAWAIDDLTVDASGVHGVARVEIEWDILSLAGTELELASVVLTTNKGSIDSLDTFFFVGDGDQDGVLAVSDFEAPATQIPGVVMPVPAVAPGIEGTFSFDVTTAVREALADQQSFFSIQGRVDEGLAGGGSARGLQVYSSASGNLSLDREPQLLITVPDPAQPLIWKITALPTNGALTDINGSPVLLNQTFTSQPTLVYTPTFGFTGADTFQYEVVEGLLSDTAIVSIVVQFLDGCAEVGRPPGCEPGG